MGGSVGGSGLGDSYGGQNSPHPDGREGSVLPEDLATQSVRLKEEQLRREGEPSLSLPSPLGNKHDRRKLTLQPCTKPHRGETS